MHAEQLIDVRARVLAAKSRTDWSAVVAEAAHLPAQLDAASASLADEVAFALGQLDRHREAIALLERTWAVEPTWRRASALAYQHYDAALTPARFLLAGVTPMDREVLRDGFRLWMERALELRPDSITDLYRLGMFEAQVEHAHDKPALRAFLAAIEAYRALPEHVRAQRGDLTKSYVKSLYAGARSALRLGRVPMARRMAFACIRADQGRDFIAPQHRFDLAGRACLASGELDHAERAFRLALDAKGPRQRDYLYGRLATVARKRGDLDGACRWIEAHTRPERRPSYLWRMLGDAQREAGQLDAALASWTASLQHDRHGKHLTWTSVAQVHAERDELARAERTYQKAIDFARRHYCKDHAPAIEGLADVLRRRGKNELAERVLAPLAKVQEHPVNKAATA